MSNIFNALKQRQGDLSGMEELSELLTLSETAARSASAADGSAEQSARPSGNRLRFPSAQSSVELKTATPRAPLLTRTRCIAINTNADSPVLLLNNSQRKAAEQYRLIRTRLAQHQNHPRMLLVTSAGPGDGKTITAINTAAALAKRQSARVLLLDGDLRRSTVHTNLNLPQGPGLYDVLDGRATINESVIEVEQLPNLSVLTGGESGEDASELLCSPQWTALCSQLRGAFDFVVIDSPPVGAVADYFLLEAECDGVLLVARPEHTSRQQCFKAFKTVPQEKFIGVVMNCVDKWFLAKGYDHDSYGYY